LLYRHRAAWFVVDAADVAKGEFADAVEDRVAAARIGARSSSACSGPAMLA
jgi:hypothetical protein